MKLICISALLCLSSIYAVVTYLRASPKNDNVVGNGFLRQNRGLGDQCSFVEDTTFQGSATLMDYDQSHGVTQGDMSIANTLMPTDDSSYPIIKAMCTITSSDPFQSAPFCTMETTFEDGGKIMLMGTPPKLTILGGTGTFFGVWGSMTTDQTFSRSNGDISIRARIDYCMREVCADDPNWRTLENKDCDWVGKHPDAKCGKYGSDDAMNGGSQVLASDACQSACGCA